MKFESRKKVLSDPKEINCF